MREKKKKNVCLNVWPTSLSTIAAITVLLSFHTSFSAMSDQQSQQDDHPQDNQPELWHMQPCNCRGNAEKIYILCHLTWNILVTQVTNVQVLGEPGRRPVGA